MAIRKKKNKKPVLDLTGPEGNVFCLMGYASRWAKQLGLDGEKIIREMQSSDYENAVQTLDKYFGNYVILER